MAQIINTNIASLNAQRNLNRTAGELATSLQRISSGLRINSAKDDAAGLAISDRMTAQIRGMNQAGRNAADAISLAQTGEGALQQMTNNLQRMRELSVQSRNATNTAADRASLDAEFQQLLSENDRVAQTTAFNGRKVLDGTLGTSVFQVGANVGETISVNVSSSMRTNAIGNFATVVFSPPDLTALAQGAAAASIVDTLDVNASGEININGFDVAAATDGTAGRGDGSAFAIGAAINASTDNHNVTATVGAATTTFTAAQIAAFAFTDNIGTDDTLTYTLGINGQQITQQTEGAQTVSTAADLVSVINAQQTITGVTANATSGGDLVLTASDGRNIEINENLGTAGTDVADQAVGFFGNTLVGSGAVGTEQELNIFKGTVTLSSNANITVTTDDVGNEVIFTGIADGGTATTNASTLSQSNILDNSDIDASINRIDQAITDIDVLRGTFGAVQSRFESTIANLETSAENISAARSRITDADFAQETAALARAQILQQAGLSILSQANSLPQNVLALLQ